MNELSKFISRASSRLLVTRYLALFSIVASLAASVAFALVLASKFAPSFEVPWMWTGPALAAAALLVAALWAYMGRMSQVRVASVVDERLDLRERLTSALHCMNREDAFARAAVEDAVNVVRDPRAAELLSKRIRVEGPRHWFVAPIIALAAAGASALPSFDFFSNENDSDRAQVQETRNVVNTALTEVSKAIEVSPALREELGKFGDLTQQGLDPKALDTPEAVKRDAIKRMTELNQKLDELLNGEKAKTEEALNKAMNQLKAPEEGPAKDLAEAMKNGDFAAAQQALQELQKQLESGKLSEDQKKQLEQQLKDLAQQLDQLSQQQKALEDALKQAGMDPQLAQNPQALQNALQNNPNLNDQQKQQIQQMANAQQQAAQMCQKMGNCCNNLGQAISQNPNGQACKAAGDKLGNCLSDAEMMKQMLDQARAAASACQGQCQGMGQSMSLQQMLAQQNQKQSGNGMGGWGFGSGGKAPVSPTPTGANAQKENTKTNQDAEIIAKQYVKGEPVVGEAKAKLQSVVSRVEETYEDGLSEDKVNPRYREAHRRYFSEMRNRLDKTLKNSEKSGANAESPSTGSKPADTKPGNS